MDREGIDLGNPRVGGRTFPRPVRTVVWVAVDGQAAALIGIGDAPRPTSATAVAALSKAGVEVVMLTGDKRGQRTADRRAARDRDGHRRGRPAGSRSGACERAGYQPWQPRTAIMPDSG